MIPNKLLQKLSDSEEGNAFLIQLNLFLNEYGKQSSENVSADTHWIESPGPVFHLIRSYMTQESPDLK